MTLIEPLFSGIPTVYDLASYVVIVILLGVCVSLNAKVARLAKNLREAEETIEEFVRIGK